MKNCLLFAVVCLFLSTAAGIGHANPWADEVVSYQNGTGGYNGHANPIDSLGMPNYVSDSTGGYTSLGWGGSIVLKFADNYLTTSGNAEKDLWIYEIGDKLESVEVYIGKTNGDWILVGNAPGGKYGIDIDAYIPNGVVAWEPYTYVKLVDLTPQYAETEPDRVSYSPWAGADIDAVAGYSTKPPVSTPEPGILLMLGAGLVACTGLIKKKE